MVTQFMISKVSTQQFFSQQCQIWTLKGAIESVPIKQIDFRKMQGLSPGTKKTDGHFHTRDGLSFQDG